MSDEYAIGIDLGTTFSCVAIIKDGDARVCPQFSGANIAPSWVWFGDKERLVGQAAKDKSIEDIERVIFDAKRLIGRDIDDDAIQADRDKWPFDLVEVGDRLKIQIKINGKEKSFYPHEISGMILAMMKKRAEEFIGKPVNNAVITVPAYFNDAQRKETIMAGSFAGLKVLRLVNEPTAAAFAYNIKNPTSDAKTILVYDLGGGTFDVAIMKVKKNKIRVLATKGDNHLGGEDFDNKLVDHCIGRVENHIKHKLKDLPEYEAKVIMRRLKQACEKAKIQLSAVEETSILLNGLYKGEDTVLDIARARFESFNKEHFEKTIEIVKFCLEDAKLTADQIDKILLVGGSTRIPKIRKMLSEQFSKLEVSKFLNPDEAVAQGAAIFADILLKEKSTAVRDESLIDVTPLSLGIKSEGGMMSVIIPRNSALPAKFTKIYSNVMENQKTMSIKIYEGERPLVEDNNLLGEFQLTDLPPGKEGQIKIEVEFNIDANNILVVKAVEKSIGRKNKIVVSNTRSELGEKEIKRIINEAKEHERADDNKRKAAEAKSRLIYYCQNMKEQINSKKPIVWIADDSKLKMLKAYDDTLEDLELQPMFEDKWFVNKKKELENQYRALTNLD